MAILLRKFEICTNSLIKLYVIKSNENHLKEYKLWLEKMTNQVKSKAITEKLKRLLRNAGSKRVDVVDRTHLLLVQGNSKRRSQLS